MQDDRRDSPSYHRNIGPITKTLKSIFSGTNGTILEIGSGSGQHVTALAKAFPSRFFQPTEISPENINSIAGWINHSGVTNVRAPVFLDITDLPWSLQNRPFGVVLCFNVVHISPWTVSECLFEGAKSVVERNGLILLYGPFMKDGEHTSDSNLEFDQWLKAKDPSFGIRDLAAMETLAQKNDFELSHAHPMPANNFLVEFRRK